MEILEFSIIVFLKLLLAFVCVHCFQINEYNEVVASSKYSVNLWIAPTLPSTESYLRFSLYAIRLKVLRWNQGENLTLMTEWHKIAISHRNYKEIQNEQVRKGPYIYRSITNPNKIKSFTIKNFQK